MIGTRVNGYEIMAAVATDDATMDGTPIVVIMAVDTDKKIHPWVTAYYAEGNSEWYWGNYFRTRDQAARDLIYRAWFDDPNHGRKDVMLDSQ